MLDPPQKRGGVKIVGRDQLGWEEVRSGRYLYNPYIKVSMEAFRKKSLLPPSPRTKKNTKSCVWFAPLTPSGKMFAGAMAVAVIQANKRVLQDSNAVILLNRVDLCCDSRCTF